MGSRARESAIRGRLSQRVSAAVWERALDGDSEESDDLPPTYRQELMNQFATRMDACIQ